MNTRIRGLSLIMLISIITLGFVTYKTTYCFMTIGDKLIISFDTMGGETIENITYTYGINTLTNKLPTPQKEGYKFGGWYLEKEYKTEIKEVPYPEFSNNAIITLYAKWDIETNKKDNLNIGWIFLSLIGIMAIIIAFFNNRKTKKRS